MWLAFLGACEYNVCVKHTALGTYLASRLPAPPARLLAVGRWDPSLLAGLPVAPRQLAELPPDPADDGAPQPGSVDAVLWHVEPTASPGDTDVSEVLRGCLQRLRELLRDDGTLLVAAPLRQGERRERLPTQEQVTLRALVRWLSELGFAILRDRDFGAEGEAGTRVLVARQDPFRIRSYRAGDEDAILRLFPACFHTHRDLAAWRWKYAEAPYGNHLISQAFAAGGELASHYSGYPIPFWVGDEGGGRSLLAMQMGDTMTHPGYRDVGRGRSSLLARTVRHFFALHRGELDFYYGFNTGPIHRFCSWFIGGSPLGSVRYWTRPIGVGWPETRGYRVERIERVDASWDRLFRRAAPHYGFLVQRDARHVDWRYLRCPDVDYVILAARRWGRLVGWGVFRRRGDTLVWGDALFHPRHTAAAAAVLSRAAAEPELTGCQRAVAWFAERPGWWRDHLVQLGFTTAPEPDDLGLVALADAEPDAIALLGRMYYTMGDGDLF